MDFYKNQIGALLELFDYTINLVPDISLMEALGHTQDLSSNLPLSALEDLGDRTYMPGKWTIRDTIQHLLDLERVHAYRAMMFARNNPAPLPGIEENAFALQAAATGRCLQQLIEDFGIQRQSTICLFRSFNREMAGRTGIAAGVSVSVLALGFVIAGHTLHHINIIQDRYLPLLRA